MLPLNSKHHRNNSIIVYTAYSCRKQTLYPVFIGSVVTAYIQTRICRKKTPDTLYMFIAHKCPLDQNVKSENHYFGIENLEFDVL